MYYDLNVKYIDDPKQKSYFDCTINALVQYGFNAIALNITSNGKVPKIPCPILPLSSSLPIRQYTRLTIVMDDPQQNYGLNAKNTVAQSYDILAVEPKTEKVFQMACQSMEIDLITFDLGADKLPFSLKHGLVREAVGRGVYFEVCLGNAFTSDLSLRKNVLANAMALIRITKGKNTIISSGVTTPTQLRGPFDLYNLAKMVGVPGHLAMATVKGYPSLLMEKVASRKFTNSSAIFKEPTLKELSEQKSHLLSDFIEFI